MYYEVVAKCGHVGRDKYYRGKFYLETKNAKVAARVVKKFGRVKKDHKDAILEVNELDYWEFLNGTIEYSENPYIQCNSKYEQNAIMHLIQEDIYPETETQQTFRKRRFGKEDEPQEYTNYYDGNTRLRNPYKYHKMNNFITI